MSAQQAATWWQECFVPLPAMQTWQKDGSTAVVGSPGSGKSTVVAWTKKTLEPEAFVVHYDFGEWQRLMRLELVKKDLPENLLAQIFAMISIEIERLLSEHPEKAASLSRYPYVSEFLTWLLKGHLDHRTFSRFRHRLSLALNSPDVVSSATDDLYSAYTGRALSELIETVRFLGFTKLVVFIDLDEYEANKNLDDLVMLFSAIPLMEQKGLVLRAALPQSSIDKGDLLTCSGGRLQAANLSYGEAACQSIIQRYLHVATEGRNNNLEKLAKPVVLKRAGLEIENLYGEQTVAGWLHWTQTLLCMFAGSPLNDPEEAAYQFYMRHVKLRLASDRQGVWRGPQFVELDDRPFDLLKALFDLKGRASPEGLSYAINESSEYINTLASRLRKKLEPVKKRHIYIHNSRLSGYWLENFVI